MLLTSYSGDDVIYVTGYARALPALTGIFLALAWICAALRIYVRKRMMRIFGWDDWALLATLVGQDIVLDESTSDVTDHLHRRMRCADRSCTDGIVG